jgi:hypothetical protein
MNVRKIMDAYGERNMARPFGDIVAERYKAVYLPFAATGPYQPRLGSSYYFQPDTELDCTNAVIKGIEIVNNTILQSNLSPVGLKDNPSALQLDRAILYISNLKREVLATLPLWDLIRNQNGGKLLFTHFDSHIWQNCYVEFTDTTGLTAANGLQFMVYYDQIKK